MNEISDSHASSSPLQYIHSWHYDMLVNQERSQFYSDLIRDNCRDKVVFEIGTGSGLLAVLAVKHGAARVICCEENPMLAMAARQLFKRLKLEDRIELIAKNSKDIVTADLPPVDIILHELFGSDPFSEEMLPTLADARRFLKPDGYFLPEKVQLIY
jgi:predicted RNA methylase